MLKPGLIRFLLSSLVIFYHLSGSIFIGTMAVYCFFMLSGYWVTYTYEEKYLKSTNPVKVFYLSRILRIFPVYLLVAVLSFITMLLYHPTLWESISSLEGGRKVLFYVSNLFIIGYNQLTLKPIVPAWSLDIELQFYIILPVLLLLQKTRTIRIIFLAVAATLTITLSVFYTHSYLTKTVISFLSYFFIGVVMYEEKVRFSQKLELIFNLLFILILVFHFSLYSSAAYISIKASNNYELYFNEILCLFTIPLLFNSVYRKSDNFDRTLGNVSYVLYLLHWVLFMPYNHFIIGLSKIQRVPVSLLYLFITYLLAYIIFIIFDKPIDKLRRTWLENRSY